jgi:hypothetical protein
MGRDRTDLRREPYHGRIGHLKKFRLRQKKDPQTRVFQNVHAKLLNASAIIEALSGWAICGKSGLGNHNRSQQSKRN